MCFEPVCHHLMRGCLDLTCGRAHGWLVFGCLWLLLFMLCTLYAGLPVALWSGAVWQRLRHSETLSSTAVVLTQLVAFTVTTPQAVFVTLRMQHTRLHFLFSNNLHTHCTQAQGGGSPPRHVHDVGQQVQRYIDHFAPGCQISSAAGLSSAEQCWAHPQTSC